MSIFEKKISFDEKTGKNILTFTADGKKCVTIPLKGKIAKRYVGFTLILEDLNDTLWWLRKAFSFLPTKTKAEDQDNIHIKYLKSEGDLSKNLRAYFYASVITFGKCFAKTKGRGIKLEAKDHVDYKYMECYKRIIGYRNCLVAHAGDEFDSGEVIIALNPNGPQFHVCANNWRLDFEDDCELQINFEELIVHVRDNVQTVVDKILNNLLNGDGKEAAIKHRKKGTVRNFV